MKPVFKKAKQKLDHINRKKCKHCKGVGSWTHYVGRWDEEVPCEKCNGTGRVLDVKA